MIHQRKGSVPVIIITAHRFQSTGSEGRSSAAPTSVNPSSDMAKKLVMALIKGDLEALDRLLPPLPSEATTIKEELREQRPSSSDFEKVIHEPLPWGSTPLHLAAEFGRTDAFRRMVMACKGDTHVLSREGISPLHAAVLAGELDIVEFIISVRKSEANEVKTGDTSSTGRLAWPQSLNDGPESNLIHCAAQMGDTDILEMLAKEGAVLDSIEPVTGLTPLQIAEANNFKVASEFLRGALEKKSKASQ